MASQTRNTEGMPEFAKSSILWAFINYISLRGASLAVVHAAGWGFKFGIIHCLSTKNVAMHQHGTLWCSKDTCAVQCVLYENYVKHKLCHSCLCHALRSGTPALFSLCTTWCVKLHRIAQSAFVYINIYQRQLGIVDQYAPLSGQVHKVTAQLTWRFSSWQCQELNDNRRI